MAKGIANYKHIDWLKKELETESYLKNVLNRRHHSALAKFCCGDAPIRLETGRYEHLDINDM